MPLHVKGFAVVLGVPQRVDAYNTHMFLMIKAFFPPSYLESSSYQSNQISLLFKSILCFRVEKHHLELESDNQTHQLSTIKPSVSLNHWRKRHVLPLASLYALKFGSGGSTASRLTSANRKPGNQVPGYELMRQLSKLPNPGSGLRKKCGWTGGCLNGGNSRRSGRFAAAVWVDILSAHNNCLFLWLPCFPA